jgi:hypothetical protein
VLDGLGCGKKTCIEGRHSLEVLHDLGPLFGNAVDGGACFAARRLADDFENAVEPLHLPPGFAFVQGKGGFQLFRLRRLGHFWEGLQNFILGKINVFQRFMKKIFKLLWFFRHGLLLCE